MNLRRMTNGFQNSDECYLNLCHRLPEHTSRCERYYVEEKPALFLRGQSRSFCNYQIQEQTHIRICPISSVDSFNEKELCKKSFDKTAALQINQNFRIKRFDCLEKDVVSAERKMAGLFMPIVNRKSTGPENADIASLCHKLLSCDLFSGPIRRRESVEKIRDIRNKLVHWPDLTALREDVENLFSNMISLFNDMSQDPDFDEVLKEVYESLQQENSILLRCEELLLKKGPNYMLRLLEMADNDANVQVAKTNIQPDVLIKIPPCLEENVGKINKIVFVDLDNCPKFFHKLPEKLPGGIFLQGFHGLKPWRPPDTVESYVDIKDRFHLEPCGNTKDAADVVITITVIEMNNNRLLPKNIPFFIVSGDRIFETLQSRMKQSARRITLVDPHKEFKQARLVNPQIKKEQAWKVVYKNIYDMLIN